MQRFIAATLVGALAVFSVAGPVRAASTEPVIAQAQTSQGTITGRVINAAGNGLSNATVTANGAGNNASTTTDANGGFTLTVPPGVYDISINRGGYQSALSSGVAVIAGGTVSLAVPLTEANLQNLQVIGRTSVTANRSRQINISSSAAASIDSRTIANRETEDITQLVAQLPGVTINEGTTSPNKSFIVHGLANETKTTIEGHPVSSGVFGSYFTQYAAAGIFSGFDVLKGAGLNGPTAGQSAVGTVNLRTPDFFSRNGATLEVGADNYGGTFYTFFGGFNTLHDRLSVLVGKSVNGYRGPTFGYVGNNFDFNDSPSFARALNQDPTITGLINYQADFSNTYSLNAQLAKVRYMLSPATSLSAEFLGLQGKFDPQGGAYGQFEGFATIAQCSNKGVIASGTGCTLTSTYNAPWVQNAIGNTNVPTYSFFPGSNVKNNQPNFSAELRTSYKDDTFVLRPYTAVINRLIDGQGEPTVAGNNGGWFQVTSNANCTTAYSAATATAGASGPCYAPNAPYGAGPYVNDPNTARAFPAQSTTPCITPTTPVCYTTPTARNNSGIWGFGTPFNQPELDKLAGYTFTYLHPVKQNTYNISFDHFIDETTKFQGDTTPYAPGCVPVLGGDSNVLPGQPGYQAACLPDPAHPGAVILPNSSLNVPDTVISQSDLSLTAQLQVTPQIEVDLGTYFNRYSAFAQVENPATTQKFVALSLANPAITTVLRRTPLDLIGQNTTYTHFDPHVGVVFRPSRDVAVRATAGSSITPPYAGLISGAGSLNFGATSDTYSLPNAKLKPETVMSYDLGSDIRTPGGVFSGDVFSHTVFNSFLGTSVAIANFPGRNPQQGTFLSQTINAPLRKAYGLELGFVNEPVIGFGYRISSTFERSFFDQIPQVYVQAAGANGLTAYNGAQIVGIPYAKAYAEIQYAGIRNALIRLGANYEGNNNSNQALPFVLFDGTLQFEVAKNTRFKITGENITNQNFGNQLGRALFAQSPNQPIAQVVNAAGVTSYRNVASANGIVGPIFRTFRFSLSRSF